MVGEKIVYNSPIDLTIVLTISLFISLTVLGLIYWMIRPKARRVTSVYLSGEGEEVVESLSPSPVNLYWSFIKRFAKLLYDYLTRAMHTGSLMDWVSYMVSWYGLLILVSIIVLIGYYFAR